VALASFIGDAKAATFAGTGKRTKRRDFRFYDFRRGEWDYHDGYTGNLLDTGMEVVRFHRRPVWAMVYRGGVLPDHTGDSAAIFEFLKEALRQATPDMPVRGPARYERGVLEYVSKTDGDLYEFAGREVITANGVAVYWHSYQGGLVGDKRYRAIVS